jgi:hypothetical protein
MSEDFSTIPLDENWREIRTWYTTDNEHICGVCSDKIGTRFTHILLRMEDGKGTSAPVLLYACDDCFNIITDMEGI